MGTWIAWSIGLVVLLGLAGVLMVRSTTHDPVSWHIDPATTKGTDKPNEALAAPLGTTRLAPDIVLQVSTMTPEDLVAALDAVARKEPRVEVVAGGIESRQITYVQRSAIIGFPDYISVAGVETPAGSGLIVWSRSRYGHSDFGVNRARIERWLGAAGLR